jgi:Protein of unknown function (DUF1570)
VGDRRLQPIPSLFAVVCYLTATLFEPQTAPSAVELKKPAELRAARELILAKERAKLQALAERLKAEGKTLEAEQAAPDPADAPSADGSSRFILLPEVVAAKPKTTPTERETIRLEAAKALFELAGQAAKPPEYYAFADDCLRNVLARQPDHAEARRLLGFLSYQGGWATPFAADKLNRKFVYDATYGWVDGSWVPHLQRGELPGPRGSNRWLPTADADALRRDWLTKGGMTHQTFKSYTWEISTEHFKIYTDVPLNEAISFGRKLEDLYQLFFAIMPDAIDPDRLPIAQRFKKPDLKAVVPNPKDAFQVFYFATRDDYARFLAPFQGDEGRTNLGIYVPKKDSPVFGKVSYFFNDVNGQLDVESTLYHEASHQLLFETAGPDDYGRNVGNFWVFEGLGTYFETLQHQPDGNLRIGGLIGPRIAQAQKRLLVDHDFLPIADLVACSKFQFWGKNGGGSVYRNYAEAMALAVFLMQAGHERYREPFLEYIQDAYKGRFRASAGKPLARPLDDRLGARYPDLDREFLEYLGRGMKP